MSSSELKTKETKASVTAFIAYQALLAKLGKHKLGKSCLYIKKLSDVDIMVLEQLIKRSYQAMTKKYG